MSTELHLMATEIARLNHLERRIISRPGHALANRLLE